MRWTRLLILLIPPALISQVSIYDIQFTTDPGEGSYPSPYVGQTVTTGGIVTATGFRGGRYFIASSQGGPWVEGRRRRSRRPRAKSAPATPAIQL